MLCNHNYVCLIILSHSLSLSPDSLKPNVIVVQGWGGWGGSKGHQDRLPCHTVRLKLNSESGFLMRSQSFKEPRYSNCKSSTWPS